MKYDVIIVGAGASGLIAMKELTAAGYKVCLLEASGEPGGRCATTRQDGFEVEAETGAEFVHKKATLTRRLLKEARIPYIPVEGKMVSVEHGIWSDGKQQRKHLKEFFKKVKISGSDRTVAAVLDEDFSDPSQDELKTGVRSFVEGFALANITDASVQAMKKDWDTMEEEMYRIDGGYNRFMNWILGHCNMPGSAIHFFSGVYKVEHSPTKVVASTSDGKQYEASKIIITVSVGVLKAREITFVPALPEHEKAIRHLGFGSVIKILLQFREPFWFKKSKNLGFILSDESIPTWWTQLPSKAALLTGWLGGPAAYEASALPGNELYEMAIASLSGIFHCEVSVLREQIVRHKIVCWDTNPYVKGGYSYHVHGNEDLQKILEKPVNDNIYFAGEAMYSGDQQGTVEAALVSGKDVAKKIMEAGLN